MRCRSAFIFARLTRPLVGLTLFCDSHRGGRFWSCISAVSVPFPPSIFQRHVFPVSTRLGRSCCCPSGFRAQQKAKLRRHSYFQRLLCPRKYQLRIEIWYVLHRSPLCNLHSWDNILIGSGQSGTYGAAASDISPNISGGTCSGSIDLSQCNGQSPVAGWTGPSCPTSNCGTCYTVTHTGSVGGSVGGVGNTITVQIIDACASTSASNFCKTDVPSTQRCGDSGTNQLDIDTSAYMALTGQAFGNVSADRPLRLVGRVREWKADGTFGRDPRWISPSRRRAVRGILAVRLRRLRMRVPRPRIRRLLRRTLQVLRVGLWPLMKRLLRRLPGLRTRLDLRRMTLILALSSE